MAGVSHSQALKIAHKRISERPKARTARDTRRQNNACVQVRVRKGAKVEPLSRDDVKRRVMSGNYRTAVIVKGNKVI